MKEIGKRLRALREGAMLSQVKMAEAIGSTQSGLNRYENGQSTPPVELLRAYADYFDVSMDYIFARTEKPQGKLYDYNPRRTLDNPQMRQFIEMCFDPGSPVSGRMKETLLQMMLGGEGEGK
jgi:transcriptional regulator with XRE-family HTH domain